MSINKWGAIWRGAVIVLIAVLTPVVALIEAGKPIDPSAWMSAGLAGLIALRAYMDQSISRVEK